MGINRNIVECKESFGFSEAQAYDVLIETLWNVKLRQLSDRAGSLSVLIETLWNVKYGITLDGETITRLVLIETLWNVKRLVSGTWGCCVTVLIETLWNVKCHFRQVCGRLRTLY